MTTACKMRQMIEGEYKLLEKRRTEARRQNVTTAVAALALVGSVYGATLSGAAGAAILQNFAGVFMLGSLWAMSSTFKTQRESAEMAEHFLTLIAPALERQMSVQMEWLESKEKITAIGFAEFRNKTLSLYQARVRSLQADVTDRCVFKHPSFSQSGRWYGSCTGGLASARGYGVVKSGSGSYVEYLGTAQDGLASGTGGMIVRAANRIGATYYEGNFRNGLPDGTVKIEEPGRKSRVREFRAGLDVGKGNAKRVAITGVLRNPVSRRMKNWLKTGLVVIGLVASWPSVAVTSDDPESVAELPPGERYRQLSLLLLVSGGVEPGLLELIQAEDDNGNREAVPDRPASLLQLDDFQTPLARIVDQENHAGQRSADVCLQPVTTVRKSSLNWRK